MTHDQECTFDPKWCSSCKLQAEARADERRKAADKVLDMAVRYPVWAYVFQQVSDVVLGIHDIHGNLIDGEQA